MDLLQQRSTAIAKALVNEIGSQNKTACLFGVKQPSVAGWIKHGISPTRENDLRFRFPNLRTWRLYPPKVEERS